MNKSASRIIGILVTSTLFLGVLNSPTLAEPNAANYLETAAQITQDALNVEYVGQFGGVKTAIAVQGGYAYIGGGPRLVVLDIGNPSTPYVVGETQPFSDIVREVAVAGDYAYIATGLSGLRVVNVSDPAHPVEVGFYVTPGVANGVTVSGEYAYVADWGSGLLVLNISDPAHPAEAGSCVTTGSAFRVAVAGSYAYVADFTAGLRVVNIADPANPVEVGFLDTAGYARGVAVSGGYAYVADGIYGLRVVDVTNPTFPVETGFFDTYGDAYGVAVSGSYAYVADGTSGLQVVNITNPNSPTGAGFFDTPGVAYGVVVVEEYAYVADAYAGLWLLNITDPANPTEVGLYITPGDIRDVIVSLGYAYILDGITGMWIMNIFDPANPVVVGVYDTPGSANGVAISGDYAYVADGQAGLRVVSITDLAHPTEVSYYDTPGFAVDVAISGAYAYVADQDYGLRVVSVADPAHPIEVGFVDTPAYASGVAISGEYAYVADWGGGLRVIYIADPTQPEEVGSYDISGDNARAVAVSGDYAYLALGSNGLRVVNISDPANPVEIGIYDTPDFAQGVALSESYAYLADDNAGLRVVNIEDPNNPVEVGFYDTPGGAYSAAVSGGNIYLADDGGGLFILQFSMSISDLGFRPNPDGYSFENYDGINLADYTITDMRRMFGDDAVCLFTIGDQCLAKYDALLWNLYANREMGDGHCDGMASTSLRFFKYIDTYPGFNNPYALNDTDNVAITWQGETFTTSVRRNIAYFYVEQLTSPVLAYKDEIRQHSPTDILTQLITTMFAGAPDPTTLFVRQEGQGGHTITPYAISNQGNGIYWIWVYDNRHPNDPDRKVIVDINADTWSYDLGEAIWSGDAYTDTLGIVPISLYAQRPECPWCDGLLSVSSSGQAQVWLSGDGHLLITDSQDRQLGYLGSDYLSDIPDAYGGFIDTGVGVALEPIYMLPLTETYSILIDGQTLAETGSASLAQFGPGYAISVDDLTVSPTTQDQFTISNDGSQITYHASQTQEPSFTLAVNSLSANYGLEIRGVDIAAGEAITLTADTTTGKLTLDGSQASGIEYTLSIRMLDMNGVHTFYFAGIQTPTNGTHIFNFGAWDGTGTILLEIDIDSDGSTDYYMQLQNQLQSIFLPVVMVGR